MFVDLDRPLNASSLLSASAEVLVIVVLGMMIGLLSSWRRFFVSGMMILEYFLVMAEVSQRQN